MEAGTGLRWTAGREPDAEFTQNAGSFAPYIPDIPAQIDEDENKRGQHQGSPEKIPCKSFHVHDKSLYSFAIFRSATEMQNCFRGFSCAFKKFRLGANLGHYAPVLDGLMSANYHRSPHPSRIFKAAWGPKQIHPSASSHLP